MARASAVTGDFSGLLRALNASLTRASFSDIFCLKVERRTADWDEARAVSLDLSDWSFKYVDFMAASFSLETWTRRESLSSSWELFVWRVGKSFFGGVLMGPSFFVEGGGH